MQVRLGDILVDRGLITPAERDQILKVQTHTPRPFGELAEELYGVSPADVEEAWAEQYAALAERVDPRAWDVPVDLLGLIDRRQAWQFGILPLRREGDEIIVCTTRRHLVRALKFVGWRIAEPVYLVLAEPDALGQALMHHYPMEGMSPHAAGFLDFEIPARAW